MSPVEVRRGEGHMVLGMPYTGLRLSEGSGASTGAMTADWAALAPQIHCETFPGFQLA